MIVATVGPALKRRFSCKIVLLILLLIRVSTKSFEETKTPLFMFTQRFSSNGIKNFQLLFTHAGIVRQTIFDTLTLVCKVTHGVLFFLSTCDVSDTSSLQEALTQAQPRYLYYEGELSKEDSSKIAH